MRLNKNDKVKAIRDINMGNDRIISSGSMGTVIEDLNDVVIKDNLSRRPWEPEDVRPRTLALVEFDDSKLRGWINYKDLENVNV